MKHWRDVLSFWVAVAVLGVCTEAHALGQAEYLALVDLWESTGGPEWERADNWLVQASEDDYDAPCTQDWWGVRCEEREGGPVVVELDLRGNNLKGTIPESLGVLVDLQGLNLNSNELSALPESVGELVDLRNLRISRNELTELPEAIRGLVSLSFLDASFNHLDALPGGLGELPELRILDVSGNNLAGLPDLAQLDLDVLAVGGNLFQGSIEDALGEGIVSTFVNAEDGRSLYFHWNAMFASPEVEVLLKAHQPACCGGDQLNFPTQTIAPGVVEADSVSSSSATIVWEPVDTGPSRAGGYRIFLSTDDGQTYEFVLEVEGKSSNAAELNSLEPSMPYVVRVESYTTPHSAALPQPYVLAWSSTHKVVSWGNQAGDNRVSFTTAPEGQATTTAGTSADATPQEGGSCACVSSGGGHQSGILALIFTAFLGRRRRASVGQWAGEPQRRRSLSRSPRAR